MKISLMVASSLDGYIAQTAQQNSTIWTSKEDTRFFKEKTQEMGIMVMGRTTFDTLKKPLPGRVNLVMTRNRELLKTNNLTNLPDLTVIKAAVTKQKWEKKMKSEMLSESIKLAKLDQQPFYTDLTPVEIIKFLQEKGWPELVVCGGAKVYEQFLVAEVIDEIYLTLEAVMFGAGVKLSTGKNMKKFVVREIVPLSHQTTLLKLWPS